MSITFEQCLDYVNQQTPGGSDESRENSAKELLARCQKYNASIERAFTVTNDYPLTTRELIDAGVTNIWVYEYEFSYNFKNGYLRDVIVKFCEKTKKWQLCKEAKFGHEEDIYVDVSDEKQLLCWLKDTGLTKEKLMKLVKDFNIFK